MQVDRRIYSAFGRSDYTSGPEKKVDITPLKTNMDTQNDGLEMVTD